MDDRECISSFDRGHRIESAPAGSQANVSQWAGESPVYPVWSAENAGEPECIWRQGRWGGAVRMYPRGRRRLIVTTGDDTQRAPRGRDGAAPDDLNRARGKGGRCQVRVV
jgi:hypothetical protein